MTTNLTLDFSDIICLFLWTAILKGIVLGLICLTTIFGNVLVLLAVFQTTSLRGPTHYLIVNLAIADLLLGLTVLPFSASLEILLDRWIWGALLCDIWLATDVLCCTGSIMSLCAISIDRYIGVTRPLKHSIIITEARALKACFFIWLLAFTASVPPFFGWREKENANHTEEEIPHCPINTDKVYAVFSSAVSFYCPTAIICALYFLIYRTIAAREKRFKLSHQANNSYRSESRNGSKLARHPSSGTVSEQNAFKMRQQQAKAAKTLGIVVGLYLICWSPFFFLLILQSFCSRCQINAHFFKVIFWLGYCNSMMNWLIYAASSPEFRSAFRRILCCETRSAQAQKKFHNNAAQSVITLERKHRLRSVPLSATNVSTNVEECFSSNPISRKVSQKFSAVPATFLEEVDALSPEKIKLEPKIVTCERQAAVIDLSVKSAYSLTLNSIPIGSPATIRNIPMDEASTDDSALDEKAAEPLLHSINDDTATNSFTPSVRVPLASAETLSMATTISDFSELSEWV